MGSFFSNFSKSLKKKPASVGPAQTRHKKPKKRISLSSDSMLSIAAPSMVDIVRSSTTSSMVSSVSTDMLNSSSTATIGSTVGSVHDLNKFSNDFSKSDLSLKRCRTSMATVATMTTMEAWTEKFDSAYPMSGPMYGTFGHFETTRPDQNNVRPDFMDRDDFHRAAIHDFLSHFRLDEFEDQIPRDVKKPSIHKIMYKNLSTLTPILKCKSNCIFLTASIYMDRLIRARLLQNKTNIIMSSNIHVLMFTSIMVASKFTTDEPYSNPYMVRQMMYAWFDNPDPLLKFSDFGETPNPEAWIDAFFRMEQEFCSILDWNLGISREEMNKRIEEVRLESMWKWNEMGSELIF